MEIRDKSKPGMKTIEMAGIARRKVWVGILAVMLLAAVFSTGCSQRVEKRERPLVVASFFPLYDFARMLAGEEIEVRCLVPAGGDPHSVEASPSTARDVAGADLVLLLGLGMDGWVAKLAGAEGKRTAVVSEGIGTRPEAVPTFGAELEAGQVVSSHSSGEADPHIWLDPILAREIVVRIAGGMVEAFPGKAELIRRRQEEVIRELDRLDEEFRSASAGFARRQVVTFHGAFSYLFARYQLETAGVIEQFPGDEPSPAYLARLAGLMRRLEMKVIFAEPQLPDRAARTLAQEIGGSIERLDPCETILVDAPVATYFDRQRANLNVLKAALAGRNAGP